MKISEGKIIGKKEIGKDIILMEIEGKINYLPGQFVMIKHKKSLLGRPFSIFSSNENSFKILFKSYGEWTKELMNEESILWWGPLGNSFPKLPGKKIFISGGVGIASLYPKIVEEKENTITIFLGFKNEGEVILKEEIGKYGKIVLSVEDGSIGEKGNVINSLEKYGVDGDVAFACGPLPMIKALRDFWEAKRIKIPLFVAMEEKMACGIGICFSCAIKTKNGIKLCCKNGPIFKIDEIDFSWWTIKSEKREKS